jgi:eukaryotic-like serine/threonine-protein kinase
MKDELPNYQILEPIGRGQYGRVFRAINLDTQEVLALKELDRKKFATSRFLNEFCFLVSLSHPNIVKCHAIEYSKNNRYLVMDYFDGGNLRTFLNSQQESSLSKGLEFVCNILQGLEYIHSKGVVHRDLKPENILLKKESERIIACISDFGISKWVNFEPACSSIKSDTGSPAYMAPEQFEGKYSYASDIYAVGIIIFEIIVGVRPFSGIPDKLRDAHLKEPVIIPEIVSLPLQEIITKALQKSPHKRFKSAMEMLKSLQLAID